jgi:hypothetical protein
MFLTLFLSWVKTKKDYLKNWLQFFQFYTRQGSSSLLYNTLSLWNGLLCQGSDDFLFEELRYFHLFLWVVTVSRIKFCWVSNYRSVLFGLDLVNLFSLYPVFVILYVNINYYIIQTEYKWQTPILVSKISNWSWKFILLKIWMV